MKFPVLVMVIAFASAILLGCCGATEPYDSGSSSYSTGNAKSSSGCSLGSYQEACTAQCKRFGEGSSCVSSCVSDVADEGMGSGSTCCVDTFRSACKKFCATNTDFDSPAECTSNCIAEYQAADYDVDACATAS